MNPNSSRPTSAPTSPTPSPSASLTYSDKGAGRPVLALHGGGGPDTINGFALPMSEHARVIAPVHPGFASTPRPADFDSIDDLVNAYLDLIERLDLRDVLVVGFSMGGWIASELAIRDAARATTARRISGMVLVNAVGIDVPGEDIADVFTLAPAELFALSFHNPQKFALNPATLTPAQLAERAANFEALAAYARARDSRDPSLRARLANIAVPALVLWGESDRVVSPAYGRAFADALPDAKFLIVPESGHMPQIEQPARLLAVVQKFAHRTSTATAPTSTTP